MVERQINKLDRALIDRAYAGRGSRPYDPVLLLKMVLYQYLIGNLSPAQWCREAEFNEVMQWLGRGYTPARRTWYDFRDRVGKFIELLHEQIVDIAIQEELLDPAEGAQDGTTVAACASRHRMVKQATLQEHQAILNNVLQGRCETPPQWVPKTESGRLDLARRMEQATVELEQRIAKNAAKPSGKRKDPAQIKVSLSDPTAPLGRDKMKVYRPLYTTQYMVALKSRLVMSYGVEADVTDAGTLLPLIDKTQALVGGRLKTVLADAAYCTIVDLRGCRERNVELLAPVQSNPFTAAKQAAKTASQIPRDEFKWNEEEQCYRCPAGHRLNYDSRSRKQRHSNHQLWEYRYRCDPDHCQACPLAASCLRPGSRSRMIKRLEGCELLDEQRAKMSLPETRKRYRLRGQTVELAYADSKGNRRQREFHGRGLTRVRTETGLMVVAQNLFRIDRMQHDQQNPAKSQK